MPDDSVGEVCARVESATEATATVVMGDGDDTVWTAREAIATVVMSDGTAASEVPGC